ncbi:MAG: serine hydrolase, partial [bacterium]|nr:serine hydrolase [bacterium]
LFVDYKKKGQTFELIGTEETGGKKYYKLKTPLTNDIYRFIYLDADSFLISKESFRSKSKPDGHMTVHYKDHREVLGVLFPFIHVTVMGDQPGGQTVIDKIEIGADLDDSIFKMPGTGLNEKISVEGFVKELDTYLKARTELDLFSGVVLVAKDGKPFFKKAYGMADRERKVPNRIDTRFCLASMNKMFTSAAVAQLVEQGKLAYGDPAGKYLGTDWMLPEVGKKVKIAHLLSHTSGIEEYLSDELLRSSADIYRELNDYKPLVKDKALRLQPGSKWGYCNTNFIFLGAIIQQVTGMTYSGYIGKYIYKPLGMNDTIEFSKDKTLPRVAMGYERVDRDGKSQWSKTAFAGKINGSPAGGGFSTVDDLLKFATALGSDTLMNKKSREIHMTERAGSRSIKYGYGFVIYKKDVLGRAVGHGGGAPGVSGNLRIFVDKGYTMIILTNLTEASLSVIGMIKNLLPHLK